MRNKIEGTPLPHTYFTHFWTYWKKSTWVMCIGILWEVFRTRHLFHTWVQALLHQQWLYITLEIIIMCTWVFSYRPPFVNNMSCICLIVIVILTAPVSGERPKGSWRDKQGEYWGRTSGPQPSFVCNTSRCGSHDIGTLSSHPAFDTLSNHPAYGSLSSRRETRNSD